LSPCDAVVVSRVDSSKLYANSTMWWRCGSLVFFQCFRGLLRFTQNIRRCWRLAMLWLRPVWIPRSSRQHR
jgi:hypothetical protein